MKKFLLFFLLLSVNAVNAQLLRWTPDFIQETSSAVTITCDANFGNKGLLGYTPTTDVYVHIGAITTKSATPSDWKYVKFSSFTTPNPAALCASLGNSRWSFSINGGLRTFYNITDPNEKILKISILFRNGNGTKVLRNLDQSDMYIPVYDNGVYARIDEPYTQPTFTRILQPISKKVGDQVSINAKGSQAGTLSLFFNDLVNPIATSTNGVVTANPTIPNDQEQIIIAELNNGSSVHRDTLRFTPLRDLVAEVPAGLNDGINYEAGGTSAVLVLYAPNKTYAFLTGDFNNWTTSPDFQMNRTPDGKRYWIRVNGLNPGQEYAYQYVVDGALRIADPFCEKVLDPWNDKFISAATYPGLKAYPEGKTSGIVSVLQTSKPEYNWKVTNFNRPDKRNLIMYEALIRDFSAPRNWKTLQDSLPYLIRLGINAIHVMPFNEFEGNESWGYNPSFYFAPDKYYGTETSVKEFIDACHQNGIAVIMDMVLNHSFGQSPMVQLYFDGANNRPDPSNPWYNPVAKHAFNVGYDFNHESQDTKDFVNKVVAFWLTEYKIDGYRFDLSKGFTQKQTCDNNGENCDVGSWGVRDPSRIAIWKEIYNDIQLAAPGAYCILEHFAENSEEKELAEYGMLLWGNQNFSYKEGIKGFTSSADFSGGIAESRGWSVNHLLAYQESHDEERLMYEAKTNGLSSGSYNVKTLATGLARSGMCAAFWAMQPGPRLMWQFGELGYDFSINYCPDGTINTNCRTGNKPVRWDYFQVPERKALYDVYSLLLKTRNRPEYLSTFTSGNAAWSLTGIVKWQSIDDPNFKVMVYGNFGLTSQFATVTYPSTGTWYNLFADASINVTNTNVTVNLAPGQYFVYTSKNVREQILPVNWVSISAQQSGPGTALIKWVTANELNNDHFIVERSTDGVTFLPLGKVAAATAGATRNNYQYSDAQPQKGTNYYRIKQVDQDGAASYSKTVQVEFDGTTVSWTIYPNPVVNEMHLRIKETMSNVTIRITDINGRTVFTQSLALLTAGQDQVIPANTFAKGIYMVSLQSSAGTQTQQIVVNK